MSLMITYAQAMEPPRACQGGIYRAGLQPGGVVEIAEIGHLGDAIWAFARTRPDLARLWACDCTERAMIRVAEADGLRSPCAWAAVGVARAYVLGLATQGELVAASGVAYSAYYVHCVPVYAAAGAASILAFSFESAADAAAHAALDVAAYAAERAWQHARLRAYCRAGGYPGGES